MASPPDYATLSTKWMERDSYGYGRNPPDPQCVALPPSSSPRRAVGRADPSRRQPAREEVLDVREQRVAR